MACWMNVLITIEKIVINAPKFARFLLSLFQPAIVVVTEMEYSYVQTRKRT